MKVNLNQALLSVEGKPMVQNGKEVVVAGLVRQMLYATGEGYTNEEKLNAFDIMCRIGQNSSEVELSSNDIVLIKRIIGSAMVAGAYGQVTKILEGGN